MVAKEVKYKGYTIRIDKSDLRSTYKYSAVMTAPDGTMWRKMTHFPTANYIRSDEFGKNDCHKTVAEAIRDGKEQVDKYIEELKNPPKKLFTVTYK